MSAKRKISIRKIIQVFVTLVVTTGCVLAISSATKIENQKTLTAIDINIKNEQQYHFLDEAAVRSMLIQNRHIDISHIPVNALDINTMERIIVANPWVSDAQIYVDNKREMHVNVVQRVPAARVFESNGNSYYLDTSLKKLPLSDTYVYYTTVVTNVPELKDDSIGRSLKAQIVAMVQYVTTHKIWNAQISQIEMDTVNAFELVPVLGNQRIIFGDTTDMNDKFRNLFAFYDNVLNRIGWDKYQTLDLRFKGQVVASPELHWTPPKGKLISNMDWVKNIIAMGARKEGVLDGAQTVKSSITMRSHRHYLHSVKKTHKHINKKHK